MQVLRILLVHRRVCVFCKTAAFYLLLEVIYNIGNTELTFKY